MENHDPAGETRTGTQDPFVPLGDEMDRAVEQLRGRFDAAAEQAARYVRANPGTSLLIALGAGYLVGRLVRS